MLTFVTHFDDNYMPFARVMLDSLYRHASEQIQVLAVHLGNTRIPEKAYPNLKILTVEDIVASFPKIATRKNEIPYREFCWLLEPALVWTAIKEAQQQNDLAVYVDADSCFFADPIPGIRQTMLGRSDAETDADICLTPHHFPPGQEGREADVGRYNFGFGVFEPRFLVADLVLRWVDLLMRGVTGTEGQKMLTDWGKEPEITVRDLPRGFNVGPWQLAEIWTDVGENEATAMIRTGNSDCPNVPLISYHFHEFRIGGGRNPVTVAGREFNRTNYKIHPSTIKSVYEPYEAELSKWL